MINTSLRAIIIIMIIIATTKIPPEECVHVSIHYKGHNIIYNKKVVPITLGTTVAISSSSIVELVVCVVL